MTKKNILFVVGGLHRAGAERFAYELDMALNKEKFQITIYCLEFENQISGNWNERYYETKHLELGTSIVYKDKFLAKKKNLLNRIENYLSRKLKLRESKNTNSPLFQFLDSFDVIHWMGEYTYMHNVPEKIKNKSLIHIMSARFQDDTIYKSFNFSLYYNFCSPFKEDEIKYELNQFENYKHTFIPLVLKITTIEQQWKFIDDSVKKIGIFTRLDRYKPLDPFLYAFHLLLDEMSNCELHLFGNGDPKKEGISDMVERLGIQEKVFFRGHQEDIVTTLFEEKISLAWFQGYNNDRPAGYAGIDICSTGLPLLCWDFHPIPSGTFNTIYPHFKNLNEFVGYSKQILTNENEATVLSKNQYTDVVKTRDINNYIKMIEDLYGEF